MTNYYDRVKETSTTTGTGGFTLDGALTGYRTFLSTVGNGGQTYYCIDDGAGNWEIGIGTLSGGTDLSRSVLSSSNSNSLVNFIAGTKIVFVCYPAERIPDTIALTGIGVPDPALGITNDMYFDVTNPNKLQYFIKI